MKKLISIFVCLMMACSAFAQGLTLSGSIREKGGAPVVGATVMLTGTQEGAVADIDGRFALTLKSKPSASATLTVSCLGYVDQVVPIGSRTVFEIILQDDTAMLEETVVIGYSTIKKKDLTGALSSVGGENITQRKTQTISQALQGAIPGVTVTRTNSAPGSEATIRVRGITSMTDGSTDPYILIDGVPGSLSDVNPEDIENLTVLKDAASASIYGSQAAAGVILITTKRAAKGKGGISYSYSLGLDTPTRMPRYMDAVSYMEAVNELRYNDLPASGWYQAYDRELVENYWRLNEANPDDYPNTDWMGLVMKNMALRHSHNLKFSVSGDKLRSSVSVGFDDVSGLYKVNNNWKRYTVRTNNDLTIFSWLTLSTDLSMIYVDKVSPHSSPALKMRYMPSIYPAVWSNGNYAPGKDGSNIYAALMSGGETNTDTFKATGKFQLEARPVKGLSITALYAPTLYFTNVSDFKRQTPYYYKDEVSSAKYIAEALTTELEETRGWLYSGTFQAYANYQQTFGRKHNVGAMAGYENYYSRRKDIVAGNSDFPNALIEDLKAGNPSTATASSSNVYELARNSFFGRLMYNYDSRYYIQGNIRVDGSSRFAPAYRWGTFLSASAGWQFSEEPFMKSIKHIINQGKLRASYGELGNERIGGYYPYQSMLSVSHPVAYVGDTPTSVTGYAQSGAIVTDLTWESTSNFDVGLDLALLEGRLTFTGDWYYKKTRGMLIEVPVAPVIGLSNPYDNLGEMHTRGWEVSLGWRDTVKDFTYKVNVNLSDDVSIMGDISGKEVISSGKIIKEGYEYMSWYGYRTNGLFQTQEEVDSSPTLGTQYPGDVRYVNIQDPMGGNEEITAEQDRVVLGSSLPHFNFGATIDLFWKGIDFNLTLQGVGKRNGYLNDYMVQPLRGQVYNFPTYLAGGASWSYKNTVEHNKQVKYPRYSWVSGGSTSTMGNYAYSDYWIINGAYLRIKNITLGYTFPNKWMKAIRVKDLRVAATLTDFFTFSHYPEGWDPEVGATSYPITKSAVFSVSVKF